MQPCSNEMVNERSKFFGIIFPMSCMELVVSRLATLQNLNSCRRLNGWRFLFIKSDDLEVTHVPQSLPPIKLDMLQEEQTTISLNSMETAIGLLHLAPLLPQKAKEKIIFNNELNCYHAIRRPKKLKQKQQPFYPFQHHFCFVHKQQFLCIKSSP